MNGKRYTVHLVNKDDKMVFINMKWVSINDVEFCAKQYRKRDKPVTAIFNGGEIKFNNIDEASKYFGTNRDNIWNCVRGDVRFVRIIVQFK